MAVSGVINCGPEATLPGLQGCPSPLLLIVKAGYFLSWGLLFLDLLLSSLSLRMVLILTHFLFLLSSTNPIQKYTAANTESPSSQSPRVRFVSIFKKSSKCECVSLPPVLSSPTASSSQRMSCPQLNLAFPGRPLQTTHLDQYCFFLPFVHSSPLRKHTVLFSF